eukprot:Awhi_evm1s9147
MVWFMCLSFLLVTMVNSFAIEKSQNSTDTDSHSFERRGVDPNNPLRHWFGPQAVNGWWYWGDFNSIFYVDCQHIVTEMYYDNFPDIFMARLDLSSEKHWANAANCRRIHNHGTSFPYVTKCNLKRCDPRSIHDVIFETEDLATLPYKLGHRGIKGFLNAVKLSPAPIT